MKGRDDAFFDVPTKTVSTSLGDVDLPARYFDGSNYVALFRVPADPAIERMRGTRLTPVLASRRAVAVLTFYKYRDTSLGPYHEVGLAVLATPSDARKEYDSLAGLIEDSRNESYGSCVLQLPVTTPRANAAGCEIWGYPKFVAELPIELAADHFSAQVIDTNGGLIMELAGQRGSVLPDEAPGLSLVTYSIHNAQLLRTRVETRCRYRTGGGGSLRLAIGESGHPMADDLRELCLEGQTPKLLQTTERFQSLLHPGVPLEPASAT
jgi:hypothetical protein